MLTLSNFLYTCSNLLSAVIRQMLYFKSFDKLANLSLFAVVAFIDSLHLSKKHKFNNFKESRSIKERQERVGGHQFAAAVSSRCRDGA